jgi:MFS family permease
MSAAAVPDATTSRSRLVVTSAIGIAQILAWGSSYYLISVLARPIGTDTGWPLSWIIAGPSIGFLISGIVSPKVGRLIEHHGGRPILAASAALLSAGLMLLAFAPTLPVYLVAWSILGVAMGAGLYDPAFSSLGRLYGDTARSAITQVTLFGGFASTICWPLSAFLVDQIGWRGACAVYAAIHLLITLPLYWFGLPGEERRVPAPVAEMGEPHAPTSHRLNHRTVFLLLAGSLTLASVIMTVISIHLLTILQTRGIALSAAVGLGALVGPSQVGARILETLFGRKLHPIWSMVASTVLVTVGLGMLLGSPSVVGVGLVLYGAGSGIRSIARGTVPLAMFGRERYAVLMGKLAMPTLIAQAGSPFIGAILLDEIGPTKTLVVLCVAALANVLSVVLLLPHAVGRAATTEYSTPA